MAATCLSSRIRPCRRRSRSTSSSLDNESTDGTRELVEDEFPEARVVTCPEHGLRPREQSEASRRRRARGTCCSSTQTRRSSRERSRNSSRELDDTTARWAGRRQAARRRMVSSSRRSDVFRSAARSSASRLRPSSFPFRASWLGERELDMTLYEHVDLLRLDFRFLHARAPRGSRECGVLRRAVLHLLRGSRSLLADTRGGLGHPASPVDDDPPSRGQGWIQSTHNGAGGVRPAAVSPQALRPRPARCMCVGALCSARDPGGGARKGAHPRACAPNGGSSGIASPRAGRPATVRCASPTGVGAARRRATCRPRTTRIVEAGAPVDGTSESGGTFFCEESAEHIRFPRDTVCVCVMDGRRTSRTAVFVCQGRAVADGRLAVGRFEDPVAAQLLRPEELADVELARSETTYVRLAPTPRRRGSACLRGGRRPALRGDRRCRDGRGERSGRDRRCGPRLAALAARRTPGGDGRPRRPSGVTGGRTGAERRAGVDRAARACRSRPEPQESRRGAGRLARPHRADDVDLGGRRAVSDAVPRSRRRLRRSRRAPHPEAS